MIDNRAQQKALLVVDMLNDFVLEGAPLRIPAASDIIAAIKRRIGNARNRGIPVVHICDAHDPDDREFEVWPPHAVAGTRGAEVVDELKPAAGDIRVAKKRFSGFYQSELDEALSRLGASHLMVTGLVTNICVLYTVADARCRDYRVTVFRDSVAALDPESHAFALKQMEEVLGAEVV
jgi:nicotinamidase-related amidase